jgi:glycerol-3-phosphate dehydrogenase
MKRDLNRLQNEQFDLIIVGGGIIGSGIARDAALRGLSTLLVEKEDFGCGTTSRSSRLIHGGLRYLRNFQFKLVRYDLKEREILLKIAPHLVHRIRFLIPLPRGEIFYRLTLPLGLWLYDLLAIGQKAPRWQRLSAAATLNEEPALRQIKELTGSYIYSDCEAGLVERLCLENLIDADRLGACVVNHAAALSLVKAGGTAAGVRVQDVLSGQIYEAKAKIVVNATGHWADRLWEQFETESRQTLRKTRGIHLVTKRLTNEALVLFAKSDGRLFFVIPWGDYSLIGTTDRDYQGYLDKVYASGAEVDYLVKETARYFPDFEESQILFTVAGLRPLVNKENISASATSRAHQIVDHARTGTPGLITVLGGKITAHRGIAQETVDLVCRKMGITADCFTHKMALPGAPAVSAADVKAAALEYKLAETTVGHVVSIYGSQFRKILEIARTERRLAEPICAGYPDIQVQIKWSVENESALTISDFMLRRSQMAYAADRGIRAVEAVARAMAGYLGWNEAERKQQIEAYVAETRLGQMYRRGRL